MGHLINANAMRLGWFSNWTDSWFSNKIYYSEFLYNVIRIRLYLIYFFTTKPMEKAGYFYSHFEIIKKYNVLTVHVFFYDGFLETFMDDFFFDHYLLVRKLNSNWMKRKPFNYYDFWKIAIIMSWWLSFN